MTTVMLTGAKGGVGTTVTAAALGVLAARHGLRACVEGMSESARCDLASVLGLVTQPDEDERVAVSDGLTFGPLLGEDVDLHVEDWGRWVPHGGHVRLLVVGGCYLALRRVVQTMPPDVRERLNGVVLVREDSRSLEGREVSDVLELPVVVEVPRTPETARAIDAGILWDRMPDDLRGAMGHLLARVLDDGKVPIVA